MYLKEAFRYQNFINDLITRTISLLRLDQYTMRTVQEHLRSKEYMGADDEVIDLSANRSLPYTADQFVKFLSHLAEEKEKLTHAISEAKRGYKIDIDAEIAANRLRHNIVGCLSAMNTKRDRESMSRGHAFKFNAEGNQVQYAYDIKETSYVDFDKTATREFCKEVANKSDKISTLIDKAMVELEVRYEPFYDVGDTFEEVIEAYLVSNDINI